MSVIKPSLYACVGFPMPRKGKRKLSEVQEKASVLTEIEEIRTEVKEQRNKRRE